MNGCVRIANKGNKSHPVISVIMSGKRNVPFGGYQSKLWRTSAPKRMRRKAVVPGITRRSGYYGRYRLPNPEKKFFDTTLAATNFSTAGTIANNSLVVIPEGDGESARIGRKIVVTNLRMRGMVQLPSRTDSGSSTQYRIIVYVDTQTNGAAATATNILETADFRSWRNLANQERFQILMDKSRVINVQSSTITAADAIATQQVNHVFKYSKKCNLAIMYDNSATTGAIGTQRSNNIGVLIIAENGIPTIQYIARVRFRDN